MPKLPHLSAWRIRRRAPIGLNAAVKFLLLLSIETLKASLPGPADPDRRLLGACKRTSSLGPNRRVTHGAME